MNKARLIAFWIVFKAYLEKVLKYISVPFLVIFFILKCASLVLVAAFALIYAFAVSIIKGQWKL